MVWFAIGLVLVSFDLLAESWQWANAFFLYLAGMVAFGYLLLCYPFKQATFITVTAMSISMGLEYLGVTYGILFGDYRYERDFGVQLAGVPITIGFAWLVVIVSTSVITQRLLGKKRSLLLFVVISSLLAVLIDLAIDPVAFALKKYWIWEQPGFFYGVPFQNFIGWFVTSAIIQAILYRTWMSQREVSSKYDRRAMLLYFTILTMFVITALVGKLYLVVIIQVTLVSVILAKMMKKGEFN